MDRLYFSSRIGACLVPIFMPIIPHNPYLLGFMQIFTDYLKILMQETSGKDIPDDVIENLIQKSVLSRKQSCSSHRKDLRTIKSQFSFGKYPGNKSIISETYFKVQDI